MSLKSDIEKFKENVPEPLLVMARSEKKRLESSCLMDNCLKTGDPAPNFTLPNQNGELISLNQLLSEGPLVVTFYRGGW